MARTADPQLRHDLLQHAVDHVCVHGLSNLSLRPLADALGVTPGTLLYHFGSKEELLMEIIRAGRERQQSALEQSDDMLSLWKLWTNPSRLPIARLFFEIYALALEDPKRFPGFLESAVEDWLRAIAPKPSAAARTAATLELAVFRGLLLDLCATGDAARTTAALKRFISLTED